MRSDTLAIRDRLLAVLRDADGTPMTTVDVCDKAGPYFEVRECRRERLGHPKTDLVSVLRCDDVTDLLAINLNCMQTGYRQLLALQKQGKVQRIRFDGQKAAYWVAVNQGPDPLLDELEQIWTVSP